VQLKNKEFKVKWQLCIPSALTFKIIYLPHTVCLFHMIVTAIVPLNSINRWVVVMEMECVSYEVRTGFVYVIRMNFVLQRDGQSTYSVQRNYSYTNS
jgi:hypothetical protein